MNGVDTLVPDLPESIADTTVATWHRKPGNVVVRDEVLVGIEADKVVLEVPASADDILDAILGGKGITVTSRQILDRPREGSSAGKEASAKPEERASTPAQHQQASLEEQNNDALGPAIHRPLAEHNLDTSTIKGTGVSGRLAHEDVGKHLAKAPAKESAPTAPAPAAQPALTARSEKRVPVTRLRKRVAERLLEAENSTVVLTTFNEINIEPIMDLRRQYGEAFEKRHGIRLGFMSSCAKAVVEVLKRCPEANTSIDGDDVVYHNYFDVSMAVSTPRDLVTPVLRDVDALDMAGIKRKIKELAIKGRNGKLTAGDLIGGNFTITNGGVFGSLMSMPTINPPQSVISGMHAIRDRPMAVNGQVEILPMMHLALSYGHRLIDSREFVGFLVTIRELLEDPTCLLLDVQ